MTITLQEYRRMEAAGEITRPLTDGPRRFHRLMTGPTPTESRDAEGAGLVPAPPTGEWPS